MTRAFHRKSVRVISATAVTVLAALLLPLLFHLLPVSGGVPLGMRLLPIFYAPFLAAVFFPSLVSLSAALLAPLVNHLLTGRPAPEMAVVLTLELLVFTGIVLLARRRWPRFMVLAPLAYLVAKLVALLVLAPFAATSLSAQAFFASLQTGLPGILALSLLNIAVVFALPASKEPS